MFNQANLKIREFIAKLMVIITGVFYAQLGAMRIRKLMKWHRDCIYPSNLATAVFVYDKLDENSMFAAAILKYYQQLRVVELGMLDQYDFETNTEFVWLGFQPTPYLLAKYNDCSHAVYLCSTLEYPVHSSVRMVVGDYSTLTDQVIDLILSRYDQNMDNSKVSVLSGNAFILSTFMRKDLSIPVDSTDRENSMFHLATAYRLIHGAFHYLHYNSFWNPLENWQQDCQLSISMYKAAIKHTKNMLDANSVPRITRRGARIAMARRVEAVDTTWYVAKRLHMLSGQIINTPRIFDTYLEFASNKNSVLSLHEH